MSKKKFHIVYDGDPKKGIIDLEKSIQCCYPNPLSEREQIYFYCPIDSSLPHDLSKFRPDVLASLKEHCEEHHRDFLFVMWPQGYNFALVYDYHDENNAENDKASVLFLVKAYEETGKKVEGSLTLDSIRQAIDEENEDKAKELAQQAVEDGELTEKIVVPAALKLDMKDVDKAMSEFFTDNEEVRVIRSEEGNLRETILCLATLMADRKLERDPNII